MSGRALRFAEGSFTLKMYERIGRFYKSLAVLINYCVIGCCGASLDFVIFLVLMHYFGIFYQYANLISVSCGIINNFILNAFLNFHTTNHFFLRMISFYMVGLVGWTVSAALLYILIEKLFLNAITAKLVIILIVTVIQFTLNQVITFRKKRYAL
jgi:putative flippase GtrA